MFHSTIKRNRNYILKLVSAFFPSEDMKLKEILELVRISACVISVMQKCVYKLRQGSGKLILVVLLGSSYEFFLLSVTFISITLPDVVFRTRFLAILMQTRKFPDNILFWLETTITMLIVTNPQ